MPALKLGHRVTVLPGVSNRKDPGSIQVSTEQARDLGKPEMAGSGIPRLRFEGKRGEVIQIGQQVLDVKDGLGNSLNERPSPIPPGCNGMVLVDDQVVNGCRVGRLTMREWFYPDELEIG